MSSSPLSLRNGARGFSLLEILVVVGIFTLLMGVAVPAFVNVRRGTIITFGTQQVADAASLARQHAVTSSRNTEVRFIKLPTANQELIAFRALQIWTMEGDSGALVPTTGLLRLPDGVIVTDDSTKSAALVSPQADAGKVVIEGVERDYHSITFLPDGSLASGYTSLNSVVTVIADPAPASATDFGTISINPVTGKVSIYRP